MKNLAYRPFALLGVHLAYEGEDAAKVKEVMDKEELNWRTFVDHGPIAQKWKPAGTPAYFIIDPRGVIRHKWAGAPGEKVIASAVQKLLKEGEPDAKEPPK